MHFGFLTGVCLDKASLQLSHKPSIITSTTMLHIKQSPTEIKESAHDQNKPPPREEQSKCGGPQRRLKTSQSQSEGWSGIQTVCSEICKLRTWSISADNVILFCSKLSAFHGGCHGNVVWKSASNRYQFLPRPRLTGRHAISSISDTKCWIVRAEQQGTASFSSALFHMCRMNVCWGYQAASKSPVRCCSSAGAYSRLKECLACIWHN